MTIGQIQSRITYAPEQIPWATGRFYGGVFSSAMTTAAGGMGSATINYEAFYVPNPKGINIVTIGVAVSGACNAGSVARLGIYNTKYGSEEKPDLIPDTLIIDGGTVGLDSTGYRSVTINQFLEQGWYYSCCAKNPTSGSGHYWSGLQRATIVGDPTLNSSPSGGAMASQVGATTTYTTNTLLPYGLTSFVPSATMLRIILGT